MDSVDLVKEPVREEIKTGREGKGIRPGGDGSARRRAGNVVDVDGEQCMFLIQISCVSK